MNKEREAPKPVCALCQHYEPAGVLVCKYDAENRRLQRVCTHYALRVANPRYYHCWLHGTTEYAGTYTAHAGIPPANRDYDYEQYEPPKRAEPDGWYIAETPEGGQPMCVRKCGDDVYYLHGTKVEELKWNHFEVVSMRLDVKWLNKGYAAPVEDKDKTPIFKPGKWYHSVSKTAHNLGTEDICFEITKDGKVVKDSEVIGRIRSDNDDDE